MITGRKKMYLKVGLVKPKIKIQAGVDYVRKILSFLTWVKRHSLVMLPVKSIVKET